MSSVGGEIDSSNPEYQEEISSKKYPESGIGLCLSGGGYRAMLFHVGVLWRLNDLKYLQKLDRISSVSGGSITAAVLGMNWNSLSFDGAFAQNFDESVTQPIRNMARQSIDVRAGLSGLFWFGTISEKVEKSYSNFLYKEKTLQALPDTPRFVINATNIQSGALWRFMKPYMRDYLVGEVKNPRITLAKAVAASSAFPPVLSPAKMKLKPSQFTPGSGTKLQRPPYTSKVVLSDGGVYDNLGMEAVYKRYRTILVSDAGGKLQAEGKPKTNWGSHSYRVLNVIDNQVRSLRKRQLIDSYIQKERAGAYWGIRTDVNNYGLSDALNCPFAKTIKLADISTRLKALSDEDQKKLINWGYAVCDAAMRTHMDPDLQAPTEFPYNDIGVG
jgi:NTE family protein